MLLKELLEKILETNATGNSKVVYDQDLGSYELIQDEVL